MSVFAQKKMCDYQRSSENVVARRGSSGSHMVPYGSVYQSYTDTGQSSDPSGLVGSRRAISGSDRFPSEPCFGTTGPDRARRIARLSRIGARLMYGPIRDPTASPRALPTGPRRAHGDAAGSRMGPYINCAPIRDSQAIRRAPSGPVVPKQGSNGNLSEPHMARWDPTSPDG